MDALYETMFLSFVLLIVSFISSSKTLLTTIHEKQDLKAAVTLVIESLSTETSTINFLSDGKDKEFLPDFQVPLVIKTFSEIEESRNTQGFYVVLLKSIEDLKMMKSKFSFDAKFLVILKNGKTSEVRDIFRWFWMMEILNVNVVIDGQNSTVPLYTFMPFKKKSCGSTDPILINEFKGEKFAKDFDNIFADKTSNLNGCEVRIAASNNSRPYAFSILLPNGSYDFHGRDVELVKYLSESLNFRINFTFVGDEGSLSENGSAEGLFLELLKNKADLIVADYWLVPYRLKFVDASVPYITEPISLIIPPGAELSSFEKFIKPFDMISWIFLSIFISCGFLVIFIIKMFSTKQTQNFVFGVSVKNPSLNICSAIFGGAQNILPKFNSARYLLMTFIIFCLVMRTSYVGSLFRFIQSKVYHQEVKSIDEMIEKDFKFYFSALHFESGAQEKLKNR